MKKTTAISLLTACLFASCATQKICPAYHSAFILDEYEQRQAYSLFTEVDGVVVPKRPYGFKFQAERGDTLTEKFLEGTKGKGWRVQAGRVHPFKKSGFTYDNWKKENLISKIFKAKEKPVLENPYLFDKIFKKKPFYQLDGEEMEIIHFNRQRYDQIVADIIDTARYRRLMETYDSLPAPIQAQLVPLLRGGFNVEQEAYNRKFGSYFPKLIERPKAAAEDSVKLNELQPSREESIPVKKGIFGLFRKKSKESSEEKKENNIPTSNDKGILQEDEQ